jgi:hypothetical protein
MWTSSKSENKSGKQYYWAAAFSLDDDGHFKTEFVSKPATEVLNYKCVYEGIFFPSKSEFDTVYLMNLDDYKDELPQDNLGPLKKSEGGVRLIDRLLPKYKFAISRDLPYLNAEDVARIMLYPEN